MTHLNPQGKPVPELVDFRITPTNNLLLFLTLNGAHFTRRLRLGAESGPTHHFRDGIVHFSRGYRKTPSRTPLMTRSDGLRGRLLRHKDLRPFQVYAAPELRQRIETEIWPIMRADPNRCPAPYFQVEAQEGVQAAQPELVANAAD